MQALLTTPQGSFNLNWYQDSRATHHLTNDLANLNMQVEDYPSSDQIRVRNGIGLSMKHIGSTKLSTPSSSFILNDVLHVLEITKNLIFVQKFTNDTNTSIEFHPSYFLVKAQVSGIILLCGPSRHGLYFPSSSNNRSPSSTTFISERTSKAQWHHCLGLHAFNIVYHVISRVRLLVFANNSGISCSACFSSKSKQLSFSLSSTPVTQPLELIYTDVWGLSPICSKTGHKYYVSFLDAFSQYT